VILSDFISDTVTKPSPAMREAMATAEVGDDVLDGDPTVGRLEEYAAQWLGKQRAVYVPSGTMANQIAMGAWTSPGDEIVVQRWAHCSTYEGGAVGALHGLQTITLGQLDGALDPEEVREAIRPVSAHCPVTKLICLEQTHNVAGGRVAPMEEVAGVSAVAREAGVRVHMDGARLANAVVASGIPASEWTAHADSVTLCLSKGLGAPVGSLTAGDEEFIERAKRLRKRYGGWMRQAGILAAAGLLALENNVERLAQDHELARDVARRLNALDGLTVDPQRVDTNIVMVGVEREGLDATRLAEGLVRQGVRGMVMGRYLRLTTHMDVGPEDAQRLEDAARAVLLTS